MEPASLELDLENPWKMVLPKQKTKSQVI